MRHLGLIKKHPDTLSTLTWMEEFSKIEMQDNSELLTVSLTGEEPNDLQVIVNNMVKSFMTIVGNEEKARPKDRLEKTKVLYEAGKEKLAEKVNAKDNLLKGSNVKDPWAMMNLVQNHANRAAPGRRLTARVSASTWNARTPSSANLHAAKKNLGEARPQRTFHMKDVLDFDQNAAQRNGADGAQRKVRREDAQAKAIRPTDATLRQARMDVEKYKKRR